jgi:hypothetical protein
MPGYGVELGVRTARRERGEAAAKGECSLRWRRVAGDRIDDANREQGSNG